MDSTRKNMGNKRQTKQKTQHTKTRKISTMDSARRK